MKIAIFGGSFDPVHIEHIRLAKAAVEELGLDKLFVMPAYAPPHKPWKVLAPDEKRLEMCRLAFAGEEKIEVSDYEIEKKGTSYTYLTCRHFKEKYPNSTLFWIVGTDMLRDFPTWKNPDDILQNATLAVCGRAENDGWLQEERRAFLQKFGKDFVCLQYEGADISSTKIRVLAGAGMQITEISALTPTAVAEYIFREKPYYIEGAKEALALEKPSRKAHSLRVAYLAAKGATWLKLPEKRAVQAALFHDCAKNLSLDSPYLEGFVLPTEWGEVPEAVVHQFAGAFIAEHTFGITDKEVLNAIRYHTSAREGMTELEKLIFLADMLEEERAYEGVEELRKLFWQDMDICLVKALEETLSFLKRKVGEVFSLTEKAYEYYKNKMEKEIKI